MWFIYTCVTCGSKETKSVNIVTCLTCVWRDSIIFVTCGSGGIMVYVCQHCGMTHLYVTCRIDMCDMTHLDVTCRINMCDMIYMWRDSIICVTCGSGETMFYGVCQHCAMTHWYVTCRVDMRDMWERRNEVSQRCPILRPLILGDHSDMALSYVWLDSFKNMWRDSFMCAVTRPYVWHVVVQRRKY